MMRSEELDEAQSHHAQIRGWLRDLLPLGMLLISGLVWGMKLEARYDRIEERQTEIKTDLKAVHIKVDELGERLSIHMQSAISIEKDLRDVERELSDHIYKNGHIRNSR